VVSDNPDAAWYWSSRRADKKPPTLVLKVVAAG
jgi:hypothetical protein